LNDGKVETVKIFKARLQNCFFEIQASANLDFENILKFKQIQAYGNELLK